mgnify:FL=1
MSSLVLDTNILVYALDRDSEYHSRVLRLLSNDDHILYTTSKNLSEYYAVVTRGDDPKLTPQEALQDIKQFIDHFNIIHSTKNSLSILQTLISSHSPKGLKIHDFEIAAIALSNGLKHMTTINKKDFKSINGLEVFTP